MTAVDRHAERRRLPAAVASLDRVLWQRVELDGDGPVGAVVAGIRRRRPVTVRVDAVVAMGLVEAGVPTVSRRVEVPS